MGDGHTATTAGAQTGQPNVTETWQVTDPQPGGYLKFFLFYFPALVFKIPASLPGIYWECFSCGLMSDIGARHTQWFY